jgi:alpha-tubulin suppressor-like RCC1 family protein
MTKDNPPTYLTKYSITNNQVFPETIDIPCSVKKISTYDDAMLILTTDGNVYALGRNSNNQFGLPGTDYPLPTLLPIQNVFDLDLKRCRSIFICNDNALYGCGDNTKYALGIVGERVEQITRISSQNYQDEKVLFVTTAYSFSIVVTDNKNLFLFGNKYFHVQFINIIVG